VNHSASPTAGKHHRLPHCPTTWRTTHTPFSRPALASDGACSSSGRQRLVRGSDLPASSLFTPKQHALYVCHCTIYRVHYFRTSCITYSSTTCLCACPHCPMPRPQTCSYMLPSCDRFYLYAFLVLGTFSSVLFVFIPSLSFPSADNSAWVLVPWDLRMRFLKYMPFYPAAHAHSSSPKEETGHYLPPTRRRRRSGLAIDRTRLSPPMPPCAGPSAGQAGHSRCAVTYARRGRSTRTTYGDITPTPTYRATHGASGIRICVVSADIFTNLTLNAAYTPPTLYLL